MSTISSFQSMKNKHDVCRVNDCVKKFCDSLREHAMEITNFKKKKNEFFNKRTAGIILICKNLKKFKDKYAKDKKIF